MDLRKLKTLIDLVSESNISELEITEADGKVRIVKADPAAVAQPMVHMPMSMPAQPAAAPAAAPLAAPAAAPAAPEAPAPAPAQRDARQRPGGLLLPEPQRRPELPQALQDARDLPLLLRPASGEHDRDGHRARAPPHGLTPAPRHGPPVRCFSPPAPTASG